MRKHNLPEISYLRNLLRYDPDTGKLFWNYRPDMPKQWNTRFARKEALTATRHDGYRVGNIDYTLYRAHRVAWAIHYGEWPHEFIDHINGNPADNRISNLRLASQSKNMKNAKRRADNTSGVTGVHWDKSRSKWKASIASNGASIELGRFNCKTAAIIARKASEMKYNFSPSHGR